MDAYSICINKNKIKYSMWILFVFYRSYAMAHWFACSSVWIFVFFATNVVCVCNTIVGNGVSKDVNFISVQKLERIVVVVGTNIQNNNNSGHSNNNDDDERREKKAFDAFDYIWLLPFFQCVYKKIFSFSNAVHVSCGFSIGVITMRQKRTK